MRGFEARERGVQTRCQVTGVRGAGESKQAEAVAETRAVGAGRRDASATTGPGRRGDDAGATASGTTRTCSLRLTAETPTGYLAGAKRNPLRPQAAR